MKTNKSDTTVVKGKASLKTWVVAIVGSLCFGLLYKCGADDAVCAINKAIKDMDEEKKEEEEKA